MKMEVKGRFFFSLEKVGFTVGVIDYKHRKPDFDFLKSSSKFSHSLFHVFLRLLSYCCHIGVPPQAVEEEEEDSED